MSFPQQEILFFKNCNIWVNLQGGSQSPELLVRDSWSFVVSKCHLKCKCSSQAGLASFQICGGKQMRKGFLAGMGLLKILTAISLVVCWPHWTCYIKSGLGSAKGEEPLNVLTAWCLTSVSEGCLRCSGVWAFCVYLQEGATSLHSCTELCLRLWPS